MPKKKITLQEAFDVIQQHGLKVKVEAVEQPIVDADESERFIESKPRKGEIFPKRAPKSATHVPITLIAQHTIASAGEMVIDEQGNEQHTGVVVETYGPGAVMAPVALAAHLLHQDALAKQVNDRFLDRRFRSYIAKHVRTANGSVNVGKLVSVDSTFDLSGYLGRLDNTQMEMI